ncbi:hypothetical protein [Paenibacillus tepidiphilus]|uniref:hypothetical protein n=1 Tax=Paenibacillus tepidiphilus TaxID=2608683 RepID=UPI00123BF02D|nr:hypothetical protein [Paenibacillus tepidiphilus]
MNKKTVILSCISVIAVVIILITSQSAANPNEIVIPEVDLEQIEDLIIGSEPPKLIYADKTQVMFETTGGVYVYDMEDKSVVRSFDTASFASERYPHVLQSSFATQDGKQLIFNFRDGPDLVAAYRYSFEDNSINKLTKNESRDYLNKRFECKYPDPQDELYHKASGTIATISSREYVYLTFQDWKVSTINVVYVQDDQETVYNVFASK